MDEQIVRTMLDMLSDIADGFEAYRDGDEDLAFWGAWSRMYGYVQDLRKRGVADIPYALKYAIFRELDHEYLLSDAKQQVMWWLESHNADLALANKFDYEKLVRMWEKACSCNTADNDTWNDIIHIYVKDEGVLA